MANYQIPNFNHHQKIQNQNNNQTGIHFGIQNLLKPSLSSGPTFSVPKNPTPAQFPATSSSSFPPASPRPIEARSTAPMAPSRKAPRGRHLIGERVVYDVDVRLSGESQPELEVTPITKYTSDATLLYGRQIAVNRSYIGYGLKPGSIRVLDMNTALRALLRGHTERVTDMAFFAEDVPLLASASVDGLIIIWKIVEGKDEEDKPQISEKIVLAIKIVGPTVPVHPRLCWHPHKQEILMVAIGNCILKIDTLRVGRGKKNPPQTFILCAIDKLIGGVTLVGKHNGEITDLSMCQWMMTRLASASRDGVVKIWADGKAAPISVIRPHDGLAVNSVTFLTSPHQPDHIVLLTAGPLNTEVKLWTSTSEEGWLLPSDAESWQCTETLEIVSSAQPKLEDAFFNQIVVLPQAGMVLLANAKKNAIYAMHIEYGPNPAATRMDYISEFSVAMPILSLSGTSVCLPDGSHVIQINCVQTQAIQQYALSLSQCLPPPIENIDLEKSKVATSHTVQESFSYSTSHLEKTSSDTMGSVEVSSSAMNPTSDNPRKNDNDVARYETPSIPKPAATAFKHSAHLITPAEILSTTILASDRSSSDAKIQDVVTDNDRKTVAVVAENAREKGTATNTNDEDESRGGEPQAVAQKKERVFNSQACGVNFRTFDIAREMAKDISVKADESEGLLRTSDQASKGQMQKGKNSQPSGSSSSAPSPHFTGYEPDHGCSDITLADSTLSQLSDMKSKLDQLVGGQQELQKQMSELISVPITKEIRRLEGSLSQNMEKIVKANLDALWARFQEENAKRAKAEAKVEEDRAQQLTNLVTSCVSRELPTMLEKIVKKDLASIGPVIARSMTQIMEKSISAAITESFQKGVGEKTVAQLEKSVSSKVETTLAKHIQSQFQTSGKQALQDALKTSLEASIIPAFEASCKNMFEQVDAAFQKGFVEHSSTAHQQFQSTHSSLAVALREAINSASTVTRTLSGELADGQRKLLALAAAGATSKSGTPLLSQLSNGSLADLAPVDPLKELSKLISERKFEEVFTVALQKSDVSIVSWLCSQVDLQGMLLATPLPLSQGVLLALLQQLSCDINNDTQRKIGWMTEVAVAIDPADPSISVHVRPIFEQVYQILSHHRNLPATSVSDANTIRLLMHVINSVVMSCK